MNKSDRIVVTGGAGFVGSRVVWQLKQKGYSNILVPRSKEMDLRTVAACKKVVDETKAVIHLAATVGGIGYNRNFPAQIYYDNISMGTHLLHEAYLAGVKKFVAIGTVCAYPKYTPVPFRETDLWNGYPEETNAPYGLAKKMLLVAAQAYRQQYGFNSIYLLPVNVYGPGDNFNPKSSHVIPALIRKIVEAKKNKQVSVTVWGTGAASREFIYVDDVAAGIVAAFENYNKPDPVNLGAGREITIKELVELIARLVGLRGEIVWDTTKPDGQPRRLLDTERAYKEFGFRAKTDFVSGLKKTIAWYKKNYASV